METIEESIHVYEIMNKPVITGVEADSLKSIANKMNRNRVGSVIIVNKKKEPIGIVTERDLVRRVLAIKGTKRFSRAGQIMSSPVLTIEPHADIEDAANMMVKHKVKKLCVMDNSKKVVGVVSEGDIVKNVNYLVDVLKEIIAAGSQFH